MLLSDSARTEFSQSEAQDGSRPYDAVIIGLAPKSLDYEHLNTAFRILKGENQPKSSSSVAPSTGTGASGSGDGVPQSVKPIPLIATHKAKYVEKDDPPGLSLGPGPFVTALENATGCEAYVVGKPTKTFFELVINDFHPSSELTPSPGSSQGEPDDEGDDGKIAIIGDDVEADLGEGAVELGLWRVLVKTGKYREGDESKPGVVPPDEVYDSFASFVDSLLSSSSSSSKRRHGNNSK
ncbi:hypothetical protein EST38_g5899 [Candolleomyces aberdarensis]|uniref:Uncharacterized protein n=1 Tax=Candolleomyces aberdarensis TaxID=2316362 RepID=A0A4Q2DM29_9AGAR|nr:hypothetical protein EST38_g5899 [Candolleomyces aberdarensis]